MIVVREALEGYEKIANCLSIKTCANLVEKTNAALRTAEITFVAGQILYKFETVPTKAERRAAINDVVMKYRSSNKENTENQFDVGIKEIIRRARDYI